MREDLLKKYRDEALNRNAERNKALEEKRLHDWERYIDNSYDYYRTTKSFETHLLSDECNNTPEKYLQLLLGYLYKYENAKRYYRHWPDYDASPEENYLEELDKITSIINKEIEKCKIKVTKTTKAKPVPKTSEALKKASFGFVGNKEVLKSFLSNLQLRLDIVNEERTLIEDLVAVFIAKDLQVVTRKIYLSCETAQFAYIIFKLSSHGLFNAPIQQTIGKSKLFYSKRGTLITANNLYQVRNQTSNPKKVEEINSILKKFFA